MRTSESGHCPFVCTYLRGRGNALDAVNYETKLFATSNPSDELLSGLCTSLQILSEIECGIECWPRQLWPSSNRARHITTGWLPGSTSRPCSACQRHLCVRTLHGTSELCDWPWLLQPAKDPSKVHQVCVTERTYVVSGTSKPRAVAMASKIPHSRIGLTNQKLHDRSTEGEEGVVEATSEYHEDPHLAVGGCKRTSVDVNLHCLANVIRAQLPLQSTSDCLEVSLNLAVTDSCWW